MTLDELNFSGIYMLKWGEAHHYVGKSVNIRERLYQHIRAMEDGSAASKLQQAYFTYGPPEALVLLECHADNIDVMEAHFINLFNDDRMLNTAILPDPFEGIPSDLVEVIVEKYSKMSFATLALELRKLTIDKLISGDEIAELLTEVSDLKVKRSDEEIALDLDKRLKVLEDKLEQTNYAYLEQYRQRADLELKLHRFYKLPWYKRIFIKPQ